MTDPIWYDLRAAWQAAGFIAKLHDKPGLKSTRPWAGSGFQAHHRGLLGEITYSLATEQPVNFQTLAGGDGGKADFPDGCDVKTCTYIDDPWLKVTKPGAALYALVLLDLTGYRGRVAGWATRSIMLTQATMRDWGHGVQYSLPARDLLGQRP